MSCIVDFSPAHTIELVNCVRAQLALLGDQNPPMRPRLQATTNSVTCNIGAMAADAPLIRLLAEADEMTGIRESSRLMVDKITTIPRSKLGNRSAS